MGGVVARERQRGSRTPASTCIPVPAAGRAKSSIWLALTHRQHWRWLGGKGELLFQSTQNPVLMSGMERAQPVS